MKAANFWPFKRKQDFYLSQNPLFEYLDKCGISFRQTQQELINLYGDRNCGWTENLNYCELVGKGPFIKGLAHPLVFQYLPKADLLIPPNDLFGYVRGSTNYRKNYKSAIGQLEFLFGRGRDASSSNTLARKWKFGASSITATVYPPELNKHFGNNSRHQSINNSENECSISIELGWCRPINDIEYNWLSTYKPYYTRTSDDRDGWFLSGRTYSWPDDLITPESGFGFSEGCEVLLNISRNNIVNILSTSWITGVERVSLLPARSGASASVSIFYKPSGQDLIPVSYLTLVSRFEGDPYAFNELALGLSKLLKVNLSEVKGYSD